MLLVRAGQELSPIDERKDEGRQKQREPQCDERDHSIAHACVEASLVVVVVHAAEKHVQVGHGELPAPLIPLGAGFVLQAEVRKNPVLQALVPLVCRIQRGQSTAAKALLAAVEERTGPLRAQDLACSLERVTCKARASGCLSLKVLLLVRLDLLAVI
eukprot:scaffold1988_cov255-Pinguiococcus_pyrenoidosus.AAC.4